MTITTTAADSISPEALAQRLARADALRQAKHWQEARDLYLATEPDLCGSVAAAARHNLALCCLALGEPKLAASYCDAALESNPALWQSGLIKAKALKELGRPGEALALLQRLPGHAEVRLELASLALNELGDAALAQGIVEPLLSAPHSPHYTDAALTSLMARLYDREQTAGELSGDLCAFSRQHFVLPGVPLASRRARTGNSGTRTRVGLISPQFCCSPVYFFCIGALKLLAGACDLVFFNRGGKPDWASAEFAAVATEWFDVARLDSEALATFVYKQNLDVLIDLGGWMDPVALRALSAKPAMRMYKWVGGQSATTGLTGFDGMFSDRYQTPRAHQHLYTEPLILLDSGYVTYTPPPYLPSSMAALTATSVPASADDVQPDGRVVLGIISNPAKVSSGFLAFLRQRIASLPASCRERVSLRFIDKRYRHPQLRQRVTAALCAGDAARVDQMQIEFIVPPDHPAYLGELLALNAVIDTFPYTGGLTTVEALSLGVPCLSRIGALFSQRHTYSHCRYAGLQLDNFDLDARLGVSLFGRPGSETIRRESGSLIHALSPRLDHEALANALCRHIVQ